MNGPVFGISVTIVTIILMFVTVDSKAETVELCNDECIEAIREIIKEGI